MLSTESLRRYKACRKRNSSSTALNESKVAAGAEVLGDNICNINVKVSEINNKRPH